MLPPDLLTDMDPMRISDVSVRNENRHVIEIVETFRSSKPCPNNISTRPRLLLVLLHGQYWCGLIARVWRQLRDLAREIDRDPLRPDAQNNALGFRIAGDDTTFAFLDRYNFRCF